MTLDNATLVDENKRTVKRFWEAFSRSDFDTVMALLAEDVCWWVSGRTGISGTYDKAGLKKLFTSVTGGTKSGVKVEPLVFTAEEDRVAMEARSDAETLDGKQYKNDYHFLHVLRAGQLVSVREYMDPEHVREVFGV